MEYIPITDSKLKIICEEEDLALYGLSADSLEYGDEAGRRFIEDILDKAQKMGDKDLVLEIQTKIGELQFGEFQEKIKSNLQRLKEQIAQS
ncbi:MAG: hypothetical protein IIX30_05165, partial [Clostridia bacterium]|nr:hypothetical protein [Clostridia bacterium]